MRILNYSKKNIFSIITFFLLILSISAQGAVQKPVRAKHDMAPVWLKGINFYINLLFFLH